MLRIFCSLLALLMASTIAAIEAGDIVFAWPKDLYTPYTVNEEISDLDITYWFLAPPAPQFVMPLPDWEVNATFQCQNCNSPSACLTVSFGAPGPATCDGLQAYSFQFCDTGVHHCTMGLFFSENIYNNSTARVSNANSELTAYQMTFLYTCLGATMAVNERICMPVLGNPPVYPTGCAFSSTYGGMSQEMVGIDGCGCFGLNADGCALCWDGSDGGCTVIHGFQNCSNSCPPPPSSAD